MAQGKKLFKKAVLVPAGSGGSADQVGGAPVLRRVVAHAGVHGGVEDGAEGQRRGVAQSIQLFEGRLPVGADVAVEHRLTKVGIILRVSNVFNDLGSILSIDIGFIISSIDISLSIVEEIFNS